MAYYLDLFSPETYEAFSRSNQTVSGFRPRQRNLADRVRPGDKFVCYMTRLSRWVGLLDILEGPFDDHTPIFYPADDPFTLRFHVKPVVWLPLEKTTPIHADAVWNGLSFTKKPTLEHLPVLDPKQLTIEQRRDLAAAYDSIANTALRAFPLMDHDPTRAAIDDALAEALRLPRLTIIRQLLAREPLLSQTRDRLTALQ